MKLAIAVVAGLSAGVLLIEGVLGFFAFLVATSILPMVAVRLMQTEHAFELADVTKEGFVPAFGAFLASWIIAFSSSA